MSSINLMRLNITMNFLKVASIWGASLFLSFRVGIIWTDIKERLEKYELAASGVKELGADVSTIKVTRYVDSSRQAYIDNRQDTSIQGLRNSIAKQP